MTIQERFSPEDLERIKKAVHDAESKISGEIVPVFVERSGIYSIANYRAALIGAATVFLLIIIFDRYVPSLAVYDPVLIFSLVMLGGFIGALKSHFLNPVKRSRILFRDLLLRRELQEFISYSQLSVLRQMLLQV